MLTTFSGVLKRSALASLVIVLLAAGAVAPAHASASKSGSKNCSGRGKIVLKVEYFASQGVKIAVKKAGPPSGPTWGVTVPPSTKVPSSEDATWTLRAYVAPYKEGRWSAYTKGHGLRVSATCSAASSARSFVTAPTIGATSASLRQAPIRKFLGDRKCPAGKKARIFADAYGKVNVGWNSGPRGPFRLVRLPAGSVIKDVYTNERNIYDADVSTNSPEGFHAAGIRCD